MTLDGRTAIVTGASSGIGASVASDLRAQAFDCGNGFFKRPPCLLRLTEAKLGCPGNNECIA